MMDTKSDRYPSQEAAKMPTHKKNGNPPIPG